MMKLSDFVVRYLEKQGVRHIFTVSGGGIMHLLDSFGRSERIGYTCNYHEQASAIAAEGYARATGELGVCLVTTGPGSTNALSGIAGAWVDSIPVLVLSGQVRRDLIAPLGTLRQLGPQEIDIVSMAKPVTKFATTVMDPASIRKSLDLAVGEATHGRPGPVWVNIPLDVQGASIEEPLPVEECGPVEVPARAEEWEKVSLAWRMLHEAKRPIVVLGNGVHLGHAEGVLESFLGALPCPVLLTIGAMDLLDERHPLYQGRFGPLGQRRANFALQNADLLLSIGASMSVSTIGFNINGFAPRAKRVMVNIDEAELARPTYLADLPVRMDCGRFMEGVTRLATGNPIRIPEAWIEACRRWKRAYPVVTPDYYEDEAHVHSYVFAHELSKLLTPEDTLLTGNSLDAWSVYHSFEVQRGQRVFTNVNYGAMGWDLPAAVGAAVGGKGQRTVLITGDGSLQFNVHELMTIGHYGLNVKIFVQNNGGYESIRATQNNFFAGRFVGSDGSSGVGNPDFAMLAAAYGLRYERIERNGEIGAKARSVLESKGPVLCELNLSRNQTRSPKASSFKREDGTMESKPLEDMFPFLPAEEVWDNMHLFDED
jgi:acetolactate synthase I/II/III large subunit